MLKIQFSDEDRRQTVVSELNYQLTQLFLVTELNTITVTIENLRYYKHLNGIKIGSKVSLMKTRLYKQKSDFETLFNTRLSNAVKTPEVTEQDFESDEMELLQNYLDYILEYDQNNKWKGILRRYIDFIKAKGKPIPLVNKSRNKGHSLKTIFLNDDVFDKIEQLLFDLGISENNEPLFNEKECTPLHGVIGSLIEFNKRRNLFKPSIAVTSTYLKKAFENYFAIEISTVRKDSKGYKQIKKDALDRLQVLFLTK